MLSFEPLRGATLRELNLADTDELPDLSPLLDCRELKLLIFRVDCLGLKALRNHPSLTSMVIVKRGGNVWQNAMPVNEFWEKFGARLDDTLRVAQSRGLIEKAIRAVPGAEDYPSKYLQIDANLKQTIAVAEKAPAFDLSVLRGLSIDTLLLENSSTTDLSGLRGTPLRKLVLAGTNVTDLTPLEGMPLEHLTISASKVTNLSPLRGMPLKRFYADHNLS